MKSIVAIFKLLRIRQWVKNLILLFPPFLGGKILPVFSLQWMLPLLAFCLVSGGVYIVNDIVDIEKDRAHPKKKYRPLAAGQVGTVAAKVSAVLCFLLGIGFAFYVNGAFVFWQVLYVVVAFSYSFWLKSVPLADLFCISAGFVFRVFAGGAAFGVVVSPWLFLSVFLLSLYLASGKRLCEKMHLGELSNNHRSVLATYPAGFLDGAMVMAGGAVLVVYTLYVVDRPGLIWSVPVCCFGLLRYFLRVMQGKGGDPTESLLRDVPLLVTSILWAAIVGSAIYLH